MPEAVRLGLGPPAVLHVLRGGQDAGEGLDGFLERVDSDGLEHFLPLIVAARLLHRVTCGHLTGLRRTQQQCHQDHHDALTEAKPEEGRFIAARCDHVGNRDDGQGGACAKARRRQAGGETAPIRKPLERITD